MRLLEIEKELLGGKLSADKGERAYRELFGCYENDATIHMKLGVLLSKNPTRFQEGIAHFERSAAIHLEAAKKEGTALGIVRAGRVLFYMARAYAQIGDDKHRDVALARAHDLLASVTDDGSYGFKGFVTDRLKQRLDEMKTLDGVEVFAVGPMPMMRAVAALTVQYKIPTQVSLDPTMVDGTGMCGGCRVTVGGEVKFACVDGPMFDASRVDFAELVRRNKMYAREEKLTNAS